MGRIGAEIDAVVTGDRSAIAEQYAERMATDSGKRIERDRAALVKAYRASPRAWPDGIDTKYDRWYRAEDWTDAGECVTTSAAIVTKSPDVTESQGAPIGSVTESPPVTEKNATVTKSLGRPPSDRSMTATERQRARRERLRGVADESGATQ